MNITIDRNRAKELLEAAINEKGADYVYKNEAVKSGTGSCHYERDGAASCIIGNALHRAGVPVEVLAKMDDSWTWEESDPDTHCSTGIRSLAAACEERGYFTLTKDALTLFVGVQRMQDWGYTWGDAMEEGLSESEQESA